MSGRIVHLFNSGVVSGPERLVLPALRKLQNVTVVFLEEERLGDSGLRASTYARELGLKVLTVPISRRLDIDAARRLAYVLADIDPVILHAHDVKATLYALWSQWKMSHMRSCQVPRVLSTHHGIKGRPDLITTCYEKFYRYFLLPLCDQVFAVSKSDAKQLRWNPILSHKVSLHQNGIEPPAPDKQLTREEALASWGEDHDGFYIGWIGRLSKEKRPLFMLDVAEKIEANPQYAETKWKILMFGEGALGPALSEQIERRNLGHRVVHKGFNPNIASQFKGFDIVTNSSLHEGLSITLLEAAFAERPLCITDTGGASELIPAESYGVKVAPSAPPHQFATALMSLMDSEPRRLQLGRGLGARAKRRFSQERWLLELQERYQTFFLLRNLTLLP